MFFVSIFWSMTLCFLHFLHTLQKSIYLLIRTVLHHRWWLIVGHVNYRKKYVHDFLFFNYSNRNRLNTNMRAVCFCCEIQMRHTSIIHKNVARALVDSCRNQRIGKKNLLTHSYENVGKHFSVSMFIFSRKMR